jgi:hypothetical protein
MGFRQYDGLIMLIMFILLLVFALYVGHQATDIPTNDVSEFYKISDGILILR